MTNVLVRGIADDTHRELVRRATQRGQSLQQYLAAELTRLATTPSMEDMLRRIETHSGGRIGLDQAVADLDEERSRR